MLERLVKGEDNLEQLLPDVWKTTHPQNVHDFRPEEHQQRAGERRYHPAKQGIATAEPVAAR